MHEFTDIFIAVDTDLIKSYLVSEKTIDLSLLKGYNQEEVFFFLDIINSSKGCLNCMYAKVCEIVPFKMGFGYFDTMSDDVEERFRRVTRNLTLIYDAKSAEMPEDLRLEFKRALDLLKEGHKLSVFWRHVERFTFGMGLCMMVIIPVASEPLDKVFRFLASFFD